MSLEDIIKSHQPEIDRLRAQTGIDLDTTSIATMIGGLTTLRLYAWWRDGVQYVGCGNQTLDQAERAWVSTVCASRHQPTIGENNDD